LVKGTNVLAISVGFADSIVGDVLKELHGLIV